MIRGRSGIPLSDAKFSRPVSFPETDSFSFTCYGHPWIPHQWLGECLMAILDRIGGLDTLLLATATVLACLYTWLAHRLLRSGLHWLPTVLVTMLTVAASANHLHVRPHISTIVFSGLTFGWLCDFEAGRIGLRRLWWLVPIFWVWSNMHGGVLGGLATIVIALSGWCVFRLARSGFAHRLGLARSRSWSCSSPRAG